MKLPLRISVYPPDGDPSAYIIRDALGRPIYINCDPDQNRRFVNKLWTPEEAKALAQKIARFLTDEALANGSED